MNLRLRNNVSVMGTGTSTLVFSHGFGCNQAMWNYLAPQFYARFRVVMYDLVGAGLSDLNAFDKAKYSSLEGYARDLNELIDEFAIGPVILVSHSVSAMIGTLADRQAPRTHRGPRDDRPLATVYRRRRLCWRLQARRYPGPARHPRQQLPRLVQYHGPGDHGRAWATGVERRTDRQFLPHRT